MTTPQEPTGPDESALPEGRSTSPASEPLEPYSTGADLPPPRPDAQVGPPPIPGDHRGMTAPARPERATKKPVFRMPHVVPDAVMRAFWCWFGAAVLGLIIAAYGALDYDDLRANLEDDIAETVDEQNLDLSVQDIDDVASALMFITLGGLVLLAAASVLLAAVMRSRHGWVRIPLALIGVLTVPLLVVGMAIMGATAQIVLVIQAILVIAAIWSMFVKESNAWFRQRDAE